MKDITPSIIAAGGSVAIEILKKQVEPQDGIRVAAAVGSVALWDFLSKKQDINNIAAYVAEYSMYEILVRKLVDDLRMKYGDKFKMSDKELHAASFAAFAISFDILARKIGLFPQKTLKESMIDVSLATVARYSVDKYI